MEEMVLVTAWTKSPPKVTFSQQANSTFLLLPGTGSGMAGMSREEPHGDPGLGGQHGGPLLMLPPASRAMVLQRVTVLPHVWR